MKPSQRAYLLTLLHRSNVSERKNILSTNIKLFGVGDSEMGAVSAEMENLFAKGIGNLNTNQLNNILLQVQQDGLVLESVKKKLEFYEIDPSSHQYILDFLQDYVGSNVAIDVEDLDASFKGVQVASRDDFNQIINQGWTGDWEINPNSIEHQRVQVASMNDDDNYPRGFYLNADITRVEQVTFEGTLRYRLYIANPVIINTGNRNVRFTANPVRYIK